MITWWDWRYFLALIRWLRLMPLSWWVRRDDPAAEDAWLRDVFAFRRSCMVRIWGGFVDDFRFV